MLLYMGVNLTEEPLCTYFCEIHPGIICISHAFPVYRIDFFTDTFQIIITLFLHVEYCILLLFATRIIFFFFTGFAKRDLLQQVRPGSPEATALLHLPPASVATKCRWVKQSINHHNTNNIITYPQ